MLQVALGRLLDANTRSEHCSFVESHFVGATAGSTLLANILQRLIGTLVQELRLDYDVPTSTSDVV